MQSTLQLYNTALARLGGHQLEWEQSPTEDNPLIALCNNLFPHVLDMTLSTHAWGFALKRVELAEKVDEAEDLHPEYRIRYALPSDCVTPVDLDGCVGVNQPTPYVIEDNDILTNRRPAVLIYVSRVTDPRRWPPVFADALAWGLAAEVATADINDPQRQQAYIQKYELAVSEAMMRDRNAQRPHKPLSPWMAARGTGPVPGRRACRD